MLSRSTPILDSVLRGLHPKAIQSPTMIRALLEQARRDGAEFHRGLNARIDLETAFVESVEDDELVLEAPAFDRRTLNGQLFLNFHHEGRPFFFATRRTGPVEGSRISVSVPGTIFYRERRDRARHAPDPGHGDPYRVELAVGGSTLGEARVADLSPSGMGILVHGEWPETRDQPVRVRFLDGRERGRDELLQPRSWLPVGSKPGWTRIGLAREDTVPVEPIPVEIRDSILTAEEQGSAGSEPEKAPPDANREPHVIRIPNAAGEEIVGLIDGWGDPAGATAVIMPNGWGQTKEVLLPLARTIVATFRSHGEPVVVLRYDGVRKRGESYNDPACRVPGREHLHFVFSQGVDDLETIARHLRESADLGVGRIVVVSFSAAAIEVRKALARDRDGLFAGWVSVAGSPDLQSMVRAISGGLDWVGGFERGYSFGIQELLGVVVDTDRVGTDAEKNELSFIEHSRRDLSEIDVPITWLHGRYDAWVDLDRVRDVLSHGETAERRLIVIPTGHQLKTSRQASEVFRFIAREVGRMALGRPLAPVAPSPREVRALRLAEHVRLPDRNTDLRAFWRDYLLGRDGSLGIELLTAGSAYRQMMSVQLEALHPQPGQRILDLGAGTGSFALALARELPHAREVRVTSLDYVKDALLRAQRRLRDLGRTDVPAVGYAEADLDLGPGGPGMPLASGSFDGALASLLLSYLERPERVLSEIHRVLRPGARLVVSSLCRDADISRLYVENFAEIQIGVSGGELPELADADLGALARNFLNDAARILELEQEGAFRFWDADELVTLVRAAGFEEIVTRRALGSPPQAVVVSARRA